MNLRSFILNLNQEIGFSESEEWIYSSDEVVIAQKILEKLNEYFFQTYDGIGVTSMNDTEYQYFSEFHKYWEAHHAEIINGKIDQTHVKQAARALHEAHVQYGKDIFKVMLDTQGLSKHAIAQVRFFTANQDFREPPENQFTKYFEANTQFDASIIREDPSGFLHFLGMSKLSQSDKRVLFAKHAAEFLLEKNITAFQIAEYFDNDALRIRNSFLESVGMGYGRKKTDMLIRDMAELGVWTNLKNLNNIDVASDRNTMKLALRTQILQTSIPLLSSFLDIFGYQYAYIDKLSADAWRAVWKEWKATNPETAPSAPCMMDFILYRIGREYCDDKVVEFICENGHHFFYFGALLRRCPQCRSLITPSKRYIPCQIQATHLPRDENGQLLLKEPNLLRTFDGTCILESVCKPKSETFKKLSPPKAISVIGRTGWTDSYAFKGEGGGGMMG